MSGRAAEQRGGSPETTSGATEVLLTLRSPLGGEVSVAFVEVPPGRFRMGSARGLPFAPEDPVHDVVMARSFLIGKFPVTQEQYAAVANTTPSHFKKHMSAPVDTVSWLDARLFCESLSRNSGRLVRLPTEAEWEYACRAGTTTEYHFGDDPRALAEHAWFEWNSSERTHPVGLKAANPWGLHDMIGNVWEWCEDVWHGDYEGAPDDGSAWMTGEDRQERRCVRGAAWNMDAFRCRCAYRSWDRRDTATNRSGFRIVLAAR